MFPEAGAVQSPSAYRPTHEYEAFPGDPALTSRSRWPQAAHVIHPESRPAGSARLAHRVRRSAPSKVRWTAANSASETSGSCAFSSLPAGYPRYTLFERWYLALDLATPHRLATDSRLAPLALASNPSATSPDLSGSGTSLPSRPRSGSAWSARR